MSRYDDALGRAVRVLRTERGLNRKELAEMASLSYPYLSEIESGRKSPSPKTQRAIAAALGITPSELVAEADRLVMGEGRWFHAAEDPMREARKAQVSALSHDLDQVRPSLAAFYESRPRASSSKELISLWERLEEVDRGLLLELARRLAFRRR